MACVRIFKTKLVGRTARKLRLKDGQLIAAVDAAMKGLVDAELGGGVIKQRIARPNEGKSGGFRAIIAVRASAFILDVYSKKDRESTTDVDLVRLRALAALLAEFDEEALERAVADGELIECRGK